MPRTSRILALALVCLTLLSCDATTMPSEPAANAGAKAPEPADAGTATPRDDAAPGDDGAPDDDATISRSMVTPETNPSVPDADYATFIAHLNKFGLDLGQALAAANALTTENIVYSPLSVSVALGMAYAGARGTTAEEMKRVLGDDFAADGFHVAVNRLARELASRANSRTDADGKPHKLELNLADALFVERSFPLRTEYLDLLGRQYDSGMRQVDFSSAPEAARMTINRWVEQQTHDRIKDLIPKNSIDSSTRLVLVNAIYFYGAWAMPFTKTSTSSAPFNPLAGETTNVPTMHGHLTLNYRTSGDLAVADFPYQGYGLRMTIVVPAAGKFESVRSQVSAAWLDQTTTGMQQTRLAVALPKFKMTTGSFILNEGLKSLGMKEMFTEKANFSGMVEDARLKVSEVVHKAFIAVDEDGTEAAAATAVVLTGSNAQVEPPVTFTVDRPFLFFIRDKNGIVLFSGQVVEPKSS